MLALPRPDLSEDAMAADDDPYAAPIVLPIPTEGHGYAPPPGRRVVAFVGTSLIYALAAAGRRRSATERRVLAMLRGEDHLTINAPARAVRAAKPVPLSKSHGLFFAELRRVPARDGIAVQPPICWMAPPCSARPRAWCIAWCCRC